MNTRHPRVCRCLQPQVWELADLNSRVLAEWVWDEPQHPMCWNNWGSHGPVPEHPRPGMGHVADPVVPCTMLRIAKAKGSNRVCSACRALDPQWSQTIGSTTAKPCKICDTLGHCAAWCCNWFLSILEQVRIIWRRACWTRAKISLRYCHWHRAIRCRCQYWRIMPLRTRSVSPFLPCYWPCNKNWSCVVLVGALWEDVLAKTGYGMLRTSEGSRP